MHGLEDEPIFLCLRRRVTRWRARWVVAAGVALAVLGGLWFVPSGTGEFLASPDGRYTARASNLSRGTLTGSRDRYLEVRVLETASGRELWRVVRRYPLQADAPSYENRDERFITWAADASSVAVPLDGRRLILSVP